MTIVMICNHSYETIDDFYQSRIIIPVLTIRVPEISRIPNHYGGTRHSSTTAIGKAMGKKKAKSFSGHNSNAAFDRYCQIGDQDDLAASQLMANMRGKVIDFDEEKRKKK
ncbi:MAG: hypothetical protein GY834_00400 [Bacteroidetes bacterium]|nr:hypothetical protein [Bacteroidota bacterium]